MQIISIIASFPNVHESHQLNLNLPTHPTSHLLYLLNPECTILSKTLETVRGR